jgi:hypothetical protein
MEFLAHRRNATVQCVVEGDDSLAVYSDGWVPSSEDFAQLGFTAKTNSTKEFSKAGFCGIVADEDELENVRDPLVKIMDFGWIMSPQYLYSREDKLKGLLKAKSLSLIAELPACPVVTRLAEHFVGLLDEIPVIWDGEDKWKLEHLDFSVKPRPIGIATRELVSVLYGIPVDLQLYLENQWIPSLTLDGPMSCPELDSILNDRFPMCADYYNRCVVSLPPGAVLL